MDTLKGGNEQTQTLPKRLDTLKETLSKPLFDFSGEKGADASTHDNNATNNVSNKHISYGNFMNFVADEEGAIPNLQKKIQYDTKSDESNGMCKPSHEIAVDRADITQIEHAWNANLDDDEEVIDHSLHGLNHSNKPSIQREKSHEDTSKPWPQEIGLVMLLSIHTFMS